MPLEDLVDVLAEQSDEVGVELLARSPRGQRDCGGDSAVAVSDLGELRQLDDARGDRDRRTGEVAGPSPSVPTLVGRCQRVEGQRWEAELFAERAGDAGMVGDHPVDVSVPGDGEVDRDAQPVQRRAARAEESQHEAEVGECRRLVVELHRLGGDVVAEPVGLLVGVGVAADVDQEGGVVDG